MARSVCKQVLIVSPEPAKDAAHLVRLIDGETRARAGRRDRGALRLGSRRFRIPDQGCNWAEAISRKFRFAGLPERGSAGLVIATSDLAAAEKALGSAGVRSAGAVCVAPAAANGTLLAFVVA